MAALKITNSIIFSFLIVIALAYAAPPSLPVLIYGSVTYTNDIAAEGVTITAEWVDSEGNKKTATTTTFTLSEAEALGHPELTGYYRFVHGQINAPSGNTVKITASENSISTSANPGIIIQVNDIIIPDVGVQGTKRSVLGEFVDKVASLLGLGKSDTDSRGLLTPQPSANPIKTGISPKASAEIKGSGSYGESSSDSAEKQESEKGDYEPSGEMTSLDELNATDQAYEGSEFTGELSEGVDVEGTASEKITEGDSSSGTEEDKDVSVVYDVSEKKESFIKRLFNRFFKPKAKKSEKTNVTEGVYTYDDEERNIWFDFILVGSIVLAILIFIFRKKLKIILRKIKKFLFKSSKDPGKITAAEFMNKDVQTLSPQSTVFDALEMFVKTNTNVIIIPFSKKVGVLTKKDLVFNLLNYDFDSLMKTKVKEIIPKRIVCYKDDESLRYICGLMIDTQTDVIVIKKDSRLVGIVELFDILRVLRQVLLRFKLENEPTLNYIINKKVNTVSSDEVIFDVLKKCMVKKGKEYVVVTENEKAIGIVTLKDMVHAIYQNINLQDTPVKQLMSAHLISMVPGDNLSDAIKVVIEKRFNQIPIIIKGKVEGIIELRNLLDGIHEVICELTGKK